ncbi:metallophosphoesterase [Methanonatronarchaeum sp. AMET-Sl]|uniref:metallophosphoesterase n=1 Tax=Methanonatronarchaeum sp. AMET-Sl TaxID=3037654 RepID=UPI00244DBBBD|nr:metallophosphoesterase [Methanonatronarchaeum sp. AMET-Sl]WGI18167.1 metallophosphoesterase [Methanonatronarchaeum sp. AMET-Sl]
MLVVSDIHGKANMVKRVVDKAGDVGLVVVLGDITDFGPKKKAEEILGILVDRYGQVVGVPGNCDPKEIDEVLERDANSIDQDKKVIDGLTFVGLGGSNPTPFDTPREVGEKEIFSVLSNLLEGEDGHDVVLVSHAPPKKTVDLTSGTHAGSESVREVVEKYEPKLVLSGHIHEAKGTAYIGDTLVVNPGAVRDGNAAVIDMKDGIDIEFINV